MADPRQLCDELRRYRIRGRIRQHVLAGILGVAQSQISRWESGRDLPRPHNVEAIKALLWGGETDPLAPLVSFVRTSHADLALFDEDLRILALAPGLGPKSPFASRAWVVDVNRNPALRAARPRFRELLSSPGAAIGLEMTIPFAEAGRMRAIVLRHSFQRLGAMRIALAEVRLEGAAPGQPAVVMNRIFATDSLPA